MELVTASQTHSLEVGTKVFIRTVTYHYLGCIEAVTDSDIVLSDASWVADSGRWSNALTTGELSEVEPYPDKCVVSRAAIVDWSEWQWELPREVT